MTEMAGNIKLYVSQLELMMPQRIMQPRRLPALADKCARGAECRPTSAQPWTPWLNSAALWPLAASWNWFRRESFPSRLTVKIHDVKMKDQIARHEIAGH